MTIDKYKYGEDMKTATKELPVNFGSLRGANANAKILRILKNEDKFTIKQKNEDWYEIDTIYKKTSGDVMDVSKESNWFQANNGNLTLIDSCK